MADKIEEKEGEEKELTIIEDGDTPEKVDKKVDKPDDKDDDDDADEEGDEGKESANAEDSRTGHTEGQEEGEDPEHAARRLERQKRKQRQREARDRNETEMRYLRLRNETLERQFSGLEQRQLRSEGATIAQRIETVKGQIETAKEVEAAAINAGEGADTVEARDIRTQLEGDLARLETAAKSLDKQAKEGTGSKEPPPETRLALEWIKRNAWYNPNPKTQDEDSAIASAVEATVLREGKDPRTPEYWEEVDKRLKKRLPHVFKNMKDKDADADEDEDEKEDDPPPRKQVAAPPAKKPGGPKVSVGGQERHLKPNEVYISPARKAAMIEAGVWDDPKLRPKYLKQYRQWDEENRVS